MAYQKFDIKDSVADWIFKLNKILGSNLVDGAFAQEKEIYTDRTFVLTGGTIRAGSSIINVPGVSLNLTAGFEHFISIDTQTNTIKRYGTGDNLTGTVPLYIVLTNNQRITRVTDLRTWLDISAQTSVSEAINALKQEPDPFTQYALETDVNNSLGEKVDVGEVGSESITVEEGQSTVSTALNNRVRKGQVGSEEVDTSTGTQTVGEALDGRVINVATVSALQALPTGGLSSGQSANVRGSLFTFEGGQWQPDGSVSLMAFGAIGDGIADDTAARDEAISTGWSIHGAGRLYKVSTVSRNLEKFSECRFLQEDGTITLTSDTLPWSTAKISNESEYTAWAQDKSYVIRNEIKVWAMRTSAHTQNAQNSLVCYVSTDGGSTYRETEYLDLEFPGVSAWAAGTDGEFEYVYVRRDDLGTPYQYSIFRRPYTPSGAGTDRQSNRNEPWVRFTRSPAPAAGQTGSPVMLHSFADLEDGTVVVGYHFGDSTPTNCGLYRSPTGGIDLTNIQFSYPSPGGERYVEPTVTFDSANSVVCGFLRPQNNTSKPLFWYSEDNLSTFGYIELPLEVLASPVPLVVKDGVLHAFCSHRSGNLEGNPRGDEAASSYYVTAIVSELIANGASAFTIYNMGVLHHEEVTGASACGVGSVVAYKNKILLTYGSEEMTGVSLTQSLRIANLYQTCISLSNAGGTIDIADKLVDNRAVKDHFTTLPGSTDTHVSRQGRHVFRVNRLLSGNAKSALEDSAFIYDLGPSSGRDEVTTDAALVSRLARNSSGLAGYRLNGVSLQLLVMGEARWRVDGNNFSLRPENDNEVAVGGAINRPSEVFAVNGTINTSDLREKEQQRETSDAEKRVAQSLKSGGQFFKWVSAVEKKGDNARWHFGWMAQEVVDAFAAEGLDAHEYGMLCYDEWEELPEIIDEETGEVVQEHRAAGNRYGLRMDQLLAFIVCNT